VIPSTPVVADHNMTPQEAVSLELPKLTKLARSDIKAKSIGKRLADDLDRAYPVVCGYTVVGNGYLLTTTTVSMQDQVSLAWFKMIDGYELHICKWQTSHDIMSTYITTESKFLGVGYILRTKLVKDADRVETYVGKHMMTWNQQDIKLLDAYNCLTTVYTKGKKGHIILYNYDNRSHHNRQTLYEALSQGGITCNIMRRGNHVMFDIPKFKATHNAAKNRLTLHNGNEQVISECSTTYLAAMLSAITSLPRKQNTIVGHMDEELAWSTVTVTTTTVGVSMLHHANTKSSPAGTTSNEALNTFINSNTWSPVTEEHSEFLLFAATLSTVTLDNNTYQMYHSPTAKFVVDGQLNAWKADEIMAGSQPESFPLTSKSKAGDWWDIRSKYILPGNSKLDNVDKEKLKDLDVQYMHDVEGPTDKDWVDWEPVNGVIVEKWTAIYPVAEMYNEDEYKEYVSGVRDELTLNSFDFWTSTDVTEKIIKYGPLTEGRLKTREITTNTFELVKHSLTPYPEFARPVDTKSIYKDHNKITGRLMSVRHVRRVVPNYHTTLEKMCKIYFHDQCVDLCHAFQSEPIGFNTGWSIDWLMKHHKAKHVLTDIEKFMTMGTIETSLSDINIHLKLESLLKPDVIQHYLEQKPRSILWQNYFVAMIFSPIFMEVKRRLKLLNHGKFIYADGCRPDQIQSMLSKFGPCNYYYENDLEKQDRQTDSHIITIELSLYKALGVHDDVLYLWQTMHRIWRFRSNFNWGFCKEMRLTGQSTTSIGNWITDMITHTDLLITQIDDIVYMIMLGDDNNIGFKVKPDVSDLRKHMEINFNMQCKPHVSTTSAAFCCFIIGRGYDGTVMVPNLKRIRQRFEVTNGVSEATEHNVKLRSLSYLMMLPPTERTISAIKTLGHDVKYEQWYNMSDAISINANYHGVSRENIENDVAILINDIEKLRIYEHSWTMWKSKRA
jgi:hypothetical protein